MFGKAIVLVGAGNAHLHVVKTWPRGIEDQLTLISEFASSPYSAMVPGFLAGEYSRDEIEIDVKGFCESRGVTFIQSRVDSIDLNQKSVSLAGGGALAFEMVSVNTGSVPAAFGGDSIALRPLNRLVEVLGDPLRKKWVIVGGGASGCELALALAARAKDASITVVHASDRLVPSFPPAVSRYFSKLLYSRGIKVELRRKWQKSENYAGHTVIVATEGNPVSLINSLDCAKDRNGFISVNRYLQSTSHPYLFAAGDSVSLKGYSTLPKNGVYAVKEGPVLRENLLAACREEKMLAYHPQKFFLTIFNTADERAVLSYGPLVLRGRWLRRWKHKIDRHWIEQFDPPMVEEMKPCGGCAAKLSAEALGRLLDDNLLPENDDVVLGIEEREDVSLHHPPPGQCEVQSVDSFRSFTSDPWLFARIATLNALNDLYAKGVKPRYVQVLLTVPFGAPTEISNKAGLLMAGVKSVLSSEGVTLLGGHSAQGYELSLGFSVTGYAAEKAVLRKAQVRAGQYLLLTKPIGSGLLLAALAAGKGRPFWFHSLWPELQKSHRPLLALFEQFNIQAATDVSGFGLVGHLAEMLRLSKVDAEVWTSQIPTYEATPLAVKKGVETSLHPNNRKFLSICEGNLSKERAEIFVDPQTSGPLLLAVDESKADELVSALVRLGFSEAAKIGRALPAAAEGPFSIKFV